MKIFTKHSRLVWLAVLIIGVLFAMAKVQPIGWYQYSDRKAGYSFKYPPNAFLHAYKNAASDHKTVMLQFDPPKFVGYQGMVVDVRSNPKRLPIEEVIAEIYRPQKPSLSDIRSSLKQLRVAGYPAVETVLKSTNLELSVLLPCNDKVYLISPSTRLGGKVDPKALKLFYRILKTFTVKC
jgi:hypothetical protein